MSHEQNTEKILSFEQEMKSVAAALGHKVLSEATLVSLVQNITKLRSTVGDRAVLRALHFFEENQRVERQVAALRRNIFYEFLGLVQESGSSSSRWLQNSFSTRRKLAMGWR